MIFYFSGTGNSKHVAMRLAEATGEKLVYICENSINTHETYLLSSDERVGFVFPVYWYTLPTIVEKFILNLKFSNYQSQYIYAAATYGIASGNVMKHLSKILTKISMNLDASYGIKMVDNYVLALNVPEKEKQKEIFKAADKEIETILDMIAERLHTEYIKKGPLAFVSPITGYAYKKTNHTKKFHVTNNCNGCGLCTSECPCNAISMAESKPIWMGDCTFCLKCLHGCKQIAIQYGKATQKKDRYHYFDS